MSSQSQRWFAELVQRVVHGRSIGTRVVVPAWNVLVYSSAYIALVATIEVAVATVLLSVPLTPAPLLVGLVAFAVYGHDRIADVDDDAVSSPGRAAFVTRHERVLFLSSSAAYGLAIALAVLGGPLALALTLVPGAFWVLYATDWIPSVCSGVRRLKDVLMVNTAVVALAWAVTLTFLPLSFADAGVTPRVGVVFAYFFLRSFVDTELPNVGDVAADRAADVATLPVVVGVPRTRQVLYGFDLATLGLIAGATAGGYLSTALAACLGAGVCYSLAVAALVGRIEDPDLLSRATEFEYSVVALAVLFVVVGG